MTALSVNGVDRKADELQIFDAISPLEYPVEASTNLFGGGLTCLNTSGRLVPGSADTTLIAAGVCVTHADNSSGAAGAITARVKPGVFKFVNSGASIAAANVGSVCYIVDDQTVALTDGGGTRPKAGVIVNVDSSGVYVAVGFSFFSNPPASPSGLLSKKTVTITEATLTDAVNGEAQTVNIGTALPSNAIVMTALATLTTQFTGGGATAVKMDVGWAGGTQLVMNQLDVFGSTAAGAEYNQGGTAAQQPVSASAKQLIATFTPDGGHNLNALTAGSVTIDVFYFVAF